MSPYQERCQRDNCKDAYCCGNADPLWPRLRSPYSRSHRKARIRGTGQRIQREREIPRGVEPLAGILLKAAVHDSLQPWRDHGNNLSYGRWIIFQGRPHCLDRSCSLEGAFAREHFVQNGAKGEDVGEVVGRFAAHLLRRHVADRSHHHSRLGLLVQCARCSDGVGLRLGELGQAEVQNFDSPVFRDEQVLRFQIAVHDAFVVRRRQAVGHLDGVIDRLPYCQRPAPQMLAQRQPIQQL